MTVRTIVLAACICAVAAPSGAHAQLGKLKDKVKQRVEKKIDEKVDCTLDKYINSKECKEARAKAGTASGAQPGTAAGAPAAASANVGEGAWSNYDFVPGDRILFAEDFTVDRVGNFPKRLELVEGNFEVVEWQGRRWLRSNGEGLFYVTLPQELPERWTMEFELTVPWTTMGLLIGTNEDLYQMNGFRQIIGIGGTEMLAHGVGRNGSVAKGTEVDPRTLIRDMFAGDALLSRPLHFRVQADGNYMKVYLEEHRIVNLPNMGRWQGNRLYFNWRSNAQSGNPWAPLITNLTINAGGKEMYDKLMADGRLAVQGIYFDVGSDRIRPESSGTLAEITDLLKSHADLKLTIEGHTDNVGASDKNRTLSQARAAAVVQYLAGKGIDAARLTPVGLGDSKPAAPNDSPENRQKNRRVELVKM